MIAEQLLQVATWHRMGEQMGGEQGQGPPMHHPHLPPHGVIVESELRNMATMHIKLEELQRRCAQQQQVRNSLLPGVLQSYFYLFADARHIAQQCCGSLFGSLGKPF